MAHEVSLSDGKKSLPRYSIVISNISSNQLKTFEKLLKWKMFFLTSVFQVTGYCWYLRCNIWKPMIFKYMSSMSIFSTTWSYRLRYHNFSSVTTWISMDVSWIIHGWKTIIFRIFFISNQFVYVCPGLTSMINGCYLAWLSMSEMTCMTHAWLCIFEQFIHQKFMIISDFPWKGNLGGQPEMISEFFLFKKICCQICKISTVSFIDLLLRHLKISEGCKTFHHFHFLFFRERGFNPFLNGEGRLGWLELNGFS